MRSSCNGQRSVIICKYQLCLVFFAELQPMTVVGVVGIGHVPGIIKNWPKEKHDLKEIMT